MLLKEYVEMMELLEGTTIEDTITELLGDLKEFIKSKNEEEAKETIKAIFKYISNNVLKVGRVESERLIEKSVAEKLVNVVKVAKEKFDMDVPANVEHRIETSVTGVSEEDDEVKPKKKGSEEYDHDEQLKKERKEKAKAEKEDEEAHKDLTLDDKDVEGKIEKVKAKAAPKKKKIEDETLDDVDSFISKVTRKK